MSRDDGLLYSGITSSSPRTNQVREEAKESKREKHSQLLPVGELVKGELQEEIDKLSKVDHRVTKTLLASGIPNALEIEMLSNAKTVDHLIAVQNRISIYLRKPSKEQVEDE